MPSWEMKIITAETQRLLALAKDDPELRDELKSLAETILNATTALASREHLGSARFIARFSEREGEAPAEPNSDGGSAGASPSRIESNTTAQSKDTPSATPGGEQPEVLKELTLGRSTGKNPVIELVVDHDLADAFGSVDLEDIEVRCRIKAEAAGLASARLRSGSHSLETDHSDDPEIEPWASRMTDWYYWRNAKETLEQVDISALDDLAGSYAALAEALALVEASRGGSRGQCEKTLGLLAEAQATVRAAVQALDGPIDQDQVNVFAWLKGTAGHHHIFLKRHMRAEDLAEPADWPDLVDRILLAQTHTATRSKPSRQIPNKPRPEPNAEILEARRLLAGRSGVLIGGACRPEAREGLISALGLSDLIWIETKVHQSIAGFEPAIARSDVAVVLLAIRWSSHAFGEVRTFCDRYKKPLVRLPGGYNPNQVAAQILAQCSGRLGG